MLLLQQLSVSLLDEVCRIEVHLVLTFEPHNLLFELVAPVSTEHIIYDGVSLLLQALTSCGCNRGLEAVQRQPTSSMGQAFPHSI